MPTYLTPNFTLEEFERVSQRALTPTEKEKARVWAREHLQPARDEHGAIRLTSFVRTTDKDSSHYTGDGVDYVPVKATIRDVFLWQGANNRNSFGRMIHERDHIHASAPNWKAGDLGRVFVEPKEGEFMELFAPVKELAGTQITIAPGVEVPALGLAILGTFLALALLK